MTPEQSKRKAELEAKRKAHDESAGRPGLTEAEKTELAELDETV